MRLNKSKVCEKLAGLSYRSTNETVVFAAGVSITELGCSGVKRDGICPMDISVSVTVCPSICPSASLHLCEFVVLLLCLFGISFRFPD